VVTSQPGFNIINGGKPQRDYTIPLFASSGLVMPVDTLTPGKAHRLGRRAWRAILTRMWIRPLARGGPKPGRMMFRSRETENRGPYQGKPDHSK